MARALPGTPAAPKAIPSPSAGSWGVVASGDGGGGIFRDTDSEAEAWLASDANGVTGYGSISGGFFKHSTHSGFARLGFGDWGIGAFGNYTGGYFQDADGSGYAWLGYDRPSGTDRSGTPNPGQYGVYAGGMTAGAYFEETQGPGHAYIGKYECGIIASGSTGGHFESTASGEAYVGYGNKGVYASGSVSGGEFLDSDGSGHARLGYDRASGNDKAGVANDGEYGVYGAGSKAGAYFEDSNNVGFAYIGYGNQGIKAYGSYAGAYFEDTDGTGSAWLGYDRPVGGVDKDGYGNDGEYGVYAAGSKAGGYFEDENASGHAYLGLGNEGILAYGEMDGGYFEDTNSSAWAGVAYSTYKISGSGTVSFVQNHPYDPSSVIVYAAPEGDEVATYTRGTARLVDGEATVPLGQTFRWVTNPDIGLTAHVTPVGDWCDLYVVEKNTDEITVRSRDGSDCAFDYLVYGLRIGFEETSVVQEKQMEAYIPSMKDHRELYARRPDLRRYNSLERFKGMRRAVAKTAKLDLSRANELRDAIVEFDPAVHDLPMAPGREETTGDLRAHGRPTGERAAVKVTHRAAPADRQAAEELSTPAAAIPVDADGNVYASSFRPSARDLASLVEVSEAVEPGDVLAVDPELPGAFRRAAVAADPTVVGVVAAEPGVVLGSGGDRGSARAAVTFAGIATCKVDAAYGPVYPGDLLVSSPTPGHAMRSDVASAGTVLGKALEELTDGTAAIKILVMAR